MADELDVTSFKRFGLVLLAAAVAGVIYAWAYNAGFLQQLGVPTARIAA